MRWRRIRQAQQTGFSDSLTEASEHRAKPVNEENRRFSEWALRKRGKRREAAFVFPAYKKLSYTHIYIFTGKEQEAGI